MLLDECRKIQRDAPWETLYLEFSHRQYVPITTDDTLYMAVEMAVRSWWDSCDRENEYPTWMQEVDEVMYCSDTQKEIDDTSEESEAEDYGEDRY